MLLRMLSASLVLGCCGVLTAAGPLIPPPPAPLLDNALPATPPAVNSDVPAAPAKPALEPIPESRPVPEYQSAMPATSPYSMPVPPASMTVTPAPVMTPAAPNGAVSVPAPQAAPVYGVPGGYNPYGLSTVPMNPSLMVNGAAGEHPRYPYYSYRRPWYTPGPASRNINIIW